MRFIIQVLSVTLYVSAQTVCGNDTQRLSNLSQYVVLATVLSNTLNDTGYSLKNYNATIAVKCAFLRFTTHGPDTGANLAGNTINVSRFGGGNSCPRGFTHATVNSTQVFFIHVSTYTPSFGQKLLYTVVDICLGGIIATPQVLDQVGSIMSEYPENVIDSQYRGTDTDCKHVMTFTPKPKPTRGYDRFSC